MFCFIVRGKVRCVYAGKIGRWSRGRLTPSKKSGRSRAAHSESSLLRGGGGVSLKASPRSGFSNSETRVRGRTRSASHACLPGKTWATGAVNSGSPTLHPIPDPQSICGSVAWSCDIPRDIIGKRRLTEFIREGDPCENQPKPALTRRWCRPGIIGPTVLCRVILPAERSHFILRAICGLFAMEADRRRGRKAHLDVSPD